MTVGLRRRIATAMRKTRALLGHAEETPQRLQAMGEALTTASADLWEVRAEVGRLGPRLDQVARRVDDTDAAIAETRDSVNLVARRTTLQHRTTRVLFLVHVLGSSTSCHPLVEAMRNSDDFEPVVASIPRRFRGSDGFYGEEEVHRGLAELGVPHLRFGADMRGDVLRLVKSIDPDIIFRQSHGTPTCRTISAHSISASPARALSPTRP